MSKFRVWLIKLLVGKRTVIMNADIDAENGIWLTRPSLVYNNKISGFKKAALYFDKCTVGVMELVKIESEKVSDI